MTKSSLYIRIAFVLIALLAVRGSPRGAESNNAAQVRIVTSDIPNFWRAFDQAKRSGNAPAAFAKLYLAPGSRGLWGFVPDRIQSPWHLAEVVQNNRTYYDEIRPYTLSIAHEVPAIRADLLRFSQVVPDAHLYDVYFVIGAGNSGGTIAPKVGVLIGTEMISRPPLFRGKFNGFDWRLLSTADQAPRLVLHELTHLNQHDANTSDLLSATINEGSADFISQFVDGHIASAEQWSFGCKREDELWKTFQTEEHSADEKLIETWLFSADPGPLNAPPFIGYWLGARIAQTYYFTHPNKRAAIHDILNIKDFPAFVTASGYPKSRPACVPALQEAANANLQS